MKSRFSLALSFVVCLLLAATEPTTIAQTSNPPVVASGSRSDPSLAAAYGRLPLSFEPNRGQTDPRVRFLSHGNGYSLFLTDSSAVLALSKDEPSSGNRPNPSERNEKKPLSRAKSFKNDVIRMELAGARPNLRVTGAEQLQGTANYFIGQDPAKWHSNLPTFARVKYEEVYPGVDLVYYGNQRQLEYDFILAPHADPKPLRLHFAGAERLKLTPNGDLAIIAKNGKIAFHKPVVYQMENGVREPVEGRFRLRAGNTVGFALGGYDRSRELVIDPVLAYSTYLGGSGGDSGNAIAVDAAGDAYVVGGTTSPDFPVTAGAFQKINYGLLPVGSAVLDNAFVTKFNPRGLALIYSTYLGGNTAEYEGQYNGDVATAVAVDGSGNAYVTGYASSYNFPVTSDAFQKVNNGDQYGYTSEITTNAFVTKLNPTGSALVYSTLLGGSGNYQNGEDYYGDSAVGIAVDSSGSAYIVGSTASGNFPVTSNAFQKINNTQGAEGFNLFIAKFNPSGSDLIYSTYLGGSGLLVGHGTPSDTAGGIAIDSAGDAYVTGTAYSRDFPVTANAYQKVNNTPYNAQFGYGGSNAIVTELNPTGSALVYSTYLGGSVNGNGGYASDGGSSIAVTSAGKAYITGNAGSTDFPVTGNAFQKVNRGSNAFVTELNPAGSALVYSTFLGGSGGESGNSIALDAFGSAYVTGATSSTNFPVTSDALQKFKHGPASSGNVFVTKFNSTGSALIYSTYLGSSGGGSGIAVDWFGDAYIAGTTCSTDFPLAGKPFQAVNNGTGCTAFFSKFIVNTVTGTSLVSDGNPQSEGVTVTFTADVTPSTGTSIPTGSVVFSVDGTPKVTVPLDDTGHASYFTDALPAGRYTVTAQYLGSSTVSGSTGSLGQTILGFPARVAVVSGTGQTTAEGSPFALPLVVQVQDFYGRLLQGAVVTFSGSGLTFSSDPVVTGADGQASVIATATATGSLTAIATVNGVFIPATFKLTAH